jgi:hypothetical protein
LEARERERERESEREREREREKERQRERERERARARARERERERERKRERERESATERERERQRERDLRDRQACKYTGCKSDVDELDACVYKYTHMCMCNWVSTQVASQRWVNPTRVCINTCASTCICLSGSVHRLEVRSG